MLMNYHEMTMNEPRDSPAKRKQFLVICTVMAAIFVHSLVSAGGFESVQIQEDGIFPGGDYVYKFTKRDYAASGSLCKSIADDIGLKSRHYGDALYATYMDDPGKSGLSGRQQRFACGYLVTDKEGKQNKKTLLEINKSVVSPTDDEVRGLPAVELWPRLTYQTRSLPSVNAAVVHFPFTNGFVSALIQSYKVIPALRKYVAEQQQGGDTSKNPPIVLSTCSPDERMCTHYAPLYKSKKFFLGEKDSETYIAELVEEEPPIFSIDGLKRTFKTMFPFAKNVV